MVWILVSLVYLAPATATDWKGPWKIGKPDIAAEPYKSEAECRREAVRLIDSEHRHGFHVPMRFRCIAIPASLPVGAPL